MKKEFLERLEDLENEIKAENELAGYSLACTALGIAVIILLRRGQELSPENLEHVLTEHPGPESLWAHTTRADAEDAIKMLREAQP